MEHQTELMTKLAQKQHEAQAELVKELCKNIITSQQKQDSHVPFHLAELTTEHNMEKVMVKYVKRWWKPPSGPSNSRSWLWLPSFPVPLRVFWALMAVDLQDYDKLKYILDYYRVTERSYWQYFSVCCSRKEIDHWVWHSDGWSLPLEIAMPNKVVMKQQWM